MLLLTGGPVTARGAEDTDPQGRMERQQRRMELREQLESERARWRHEAHPGGRGEQGARPGHGRLSPEERRELRDALRERRP